MGNTLSVSESRSDCSLAAGAATESYDVSACEGCRGDRPRMKTRSNGQQWARMRARVHLSHAACDVGRVCACLVGRGHAHAHETKSAPSCVKAALELADEPMISTKARFAVAISSSERMISLGVPPNRGLSCEVGRVEVMGMHMPCWP